MNYAQKVDLFHRALASFGVGRAKAPFVGRACTPALAKDIRGAVADAVKDYFFELGMEDLAIELASEVAVVQHRFEKSRYAIAMRSSLRPSGEDESGDWERVDDLEPR